MAYKDRYLEYLEMIPKSIEYCNENDNAPLFAFTSNLDVVLHWDIDTYNDILLSSLKEKPKVKEGETIKTMEDFARITCYYASRGLGGNFDITNIEVCNELMELFGYEYSLGGTCAQAAAAFGTIGFPVNVHLTDDCKEVCEMMNHPRTQVIKDGKRVPVMEGATNKEPIYHFILQFKKGDKLLIRGEEVEIPISNRLILFFDKVHKEVPISNDFLNYWIDSKEVPASYLISGFDAIYDEEIFEKKLQELEPHLQSIKKKHPETILYFEGAFYMNPEIKDMALHKLSKYVDILGINEEELRDQLIRFEEFIDIIKPNEIVDGLDVMLSKFPVLGIILHTKDYAIYYGYELKGIDIEQGLTMGNVMSATRARLGRYGKLEECRETLNVPLSKVGLELVEAVSLKESEIKVIAETDKNNSHDIIIKVVPSRYLEYPKYTIGLGDTFVAGVNTCFIKRNK